jgi:hypothetical protein
MAKTFFKKGELSKMSKALLHNRFVLYFVFLLAVSNMFHFVFKQDITSASVLIVTGLLTSFFSKNMVVIMVVAMVVANVFRMTQGPEGFQPKRDEDDEKETFADVMNALENSAAEMFKDVDEEDDEEIDEEDLKKLLDIDDDEEEEEEDKKEKTTPKKGSKKESMKNKEKFGSRKNKR